MTERVKGILQQVRRGLEGIYGPRLKGLVVFGSHARGEATADSDLDLLFVLDDFASPFEEITRTSALVSDICLEYGELLSLIPIRDQEWRERDSVFLAAAREEGVAVP
jgi:predicted nucleotidyltransferase